MPDNISVTNQGDKTIVKNDKGELSFTRSQSGNALADAGTQKSLLANAVIGLTSGFAKTMEIVGTGYKAVIKDQGLPAGRQGLELSLGFSHPVSFSAPEGITLTVKDNRFITVAGADKSLVGQVAANLRRLRRPDVYKGKGVRYQGEIIKLKPGKAAKAAEA
ncbi:50S ribosomal protein L6 [Candidatus Beckwithbacteria bacterium CG22_combo_CG10-13_8_21_14_all_01_47_9]|uniref:50S ribosomal protein L6 n=5 Tax=Candidatus Beckwithiibacteriota TaxID=1752726 RepID=A0A2H0E0N6_9BACT|nr:MAG: 50S ribosomal protein L6 [Candidatus Beckwithbacteria bacterium CG1_02_47_37]PIP52426.1 MAG: 50S ribosomal protein L6 [Candidatus Beckwithbacteria bacterium CG23_combo_of_CG06-09_8_20_14_all_47_9]PIP87993.1 MAG: 50S ribosomal protein L6 [Candidatus Beckwithbacteria bacterium CG22_combo_CG10-13_8_21_14_all_01_47_9]PJA22550.1 MAG: 50S ribosomal protein L6 [Candidatus Beckwithbacteria bacterium CG_4_10_14_0_2_um_filter_47_25]PJC66516.1 MAG: 50S ribosomal protein L6 [Candidatus Beckwithbact